MHTIEFLLIFVPAVLVVVGYQVFVNYPGRTPVDPE